MSINRDYFWFRLFKTRGIGPKLLISVAKILEAENLNPEILPRSQSDLSVQFPKLAKILNGKIRAEDKERVTTAYEQLKKQGIDIIHPGHPDSPPHIREISPILFIKGQHKLLTSDGVAIVGARDVSNEGIRVARTIATGLAREGINVVSGYAKGVDSEAHSAALASGGTTTLVLPHGITGLRQKKAFRNFNWGRDVLAVSQFAPDAKWLARHAMMRNTLICALSKAVVVIESGPERNANGKMSGSFDTGKAALKMNLPLFIVDPEYFVKPPEGNTDLIRLGGRKLNPRNGVLDILRYLTKTPPEEPSGSTINARDTSYIQMSLLTDFQVSTEHSATGS